MPWIYAPDKAGDHHDWKEGENREKPRRQQRIQVKPQGQGYAGHRHPRQAVRQSCWIWSVHARHGGRRGGRTKDDAALFLPDLRPDLCFIDLITFGMAGNLPAKRSKFVELE